jgi:glycine/D-amino acid oxidase-like deaminating enzyme
MGGIRQQFCTRVTVQMAQYSVGIWKTFDRVLAGDGPRAAFEQRGYLFLADGRAADALQARYERQRAAGAAAERLSLDDIRALVPDLWLDDILFGVFGPEDGYASPRAVLRGLRRAAEVSGVEYRHDEVTRLVARGGRVTGVALANGGHLDAPWIVNAAGPWAGALAARAGLRVPVQPVRQTLFRATLPRRWPYRFPMVIDPGGVHWRHDDPVRAGDPDRIVVAFTRWDEPIGERFDPATERWEREFLPALARRLPAFRDLGGVEGWAGLYEMTPDHNPVIGEHPGLRGLVFAGGFSGHGIMMAPATGRIVSEIVRTGGWRSFDVSIFAPDRFERGALVHDAATI